MLLTMGFGGFAQTTITIGTGTSDTYTLPFNNFYKNSWNEMIYPASLITETGNIVSIAFHVSAVPSSNYPFSTMTIYMGTRPDSIHPSTTSWLPMSELTEVYSITNMPSPTDTGWMTINLDTPFLYDGSEHLVIAISKTMASYSSALKFFYTTGPSGCSMYRQNDSDASYANHPGSSAGTNSTYRPNLQLTFTPISGDYCYPVKNLSATDVTTSDATISWGSSESAISYVVQYKTADQTWDDEDVYTLTTPDTIFYLNGLMAVTTYNVRVASYCGSDTSAWKTVTFTTPCEATWDILPYEEDFEGYATYSVPNCWTRLQTYTSGTTVYPYIANASATAHNGTGYLYTYGGNNFVALPVFNESVNNLRLTFWMKPAGTTSSYGHVEVGVMSDLNNAASFQQVASWYADSIGSTAWKKYMVDFTDVNTSDSDHIVIRRYVSSTYAWYFDDVSVDYIPLCDAPTELSVVGATPNSVTLRWNPGEESVFTVYYKTSDDEEYTAVTGVYLDSDSTYLLSNLDPATNYTVYVAAVCSDGTETAGDPISCATTMIPADLPYTTDFGEDSDQNWLLNNGTCTNYWVMGAIPDTTANALFITTDGTTPGYTLSSAISMVSASKLFTIGTNSQVQISFDLMVGGESSFDYIKLFFAPETETYPAKAGVVPTSSEYGYNSYSLYAFDFSDYASLSTYASATTYPYRFNLTGGNVVHIDAIMPNPHTNPDDNSTAQVVFAWKNDGGGGTQPGAIISNLSVSVVSCPSPENLMVASLETHSAVVTWDENSAVSSWNVEYGEHGFVLGNGTEVEVLGNPEITLGSLDASTEYDVYVYSNCGDGTSVSTFTTFKTPCEPFTTLPFTENFDSISGTTSTSLSVSNLPECWSNYNNSTSSSYTGYPIVYSSATYAASGSNSMRFYTYTSGSTTYGDQIAVLPVFDPTLYPVNTLQINFDARVNATSYPFVLVVGVMSNPFDRTTFVGVDTITTQITTYQSYEIPLSHYTGNGNYIALMAPQPTNYNYGYVDNIVVDLIPSCPKPTHFEVAGLSSNSVDFTWTETGSATAWEIEYGPVGFTPGGNAGTVETVTNEPPYTLSNLTANTTYDFYIRANCGNEYSAYATKLTVTTACEPLTTLPFTENFDSIPGTTSGSTNNLPDCWNYLNEGTSTSYCGYPIVYNGSTYAASGSNSLRFYTYTTSGTYDDQIAILPLIDPVLYPVNTLQLSFDARSYSSYTFTLLVGVMTNPTDKTTFEPIDTVVTTSNAYVSYDFPLNQYTGSGNYIALMALKPASSYNAGYVDNIVLDLIPMCPRPSQLTAVNATTTSIELDWTENGSATTWEIAYGAPGFNPDSTYDLVTATSVPFEVQGLSTSALYQFYVRAVCDGSEYSNWSNVVQAATACDLMPVPYSENFNAYTTAATTTPPSTYPDDIMPLCWTFLNRSTSTSSYPIAYISSASAYVVTGNSLFFKSSSTTPIYAVLPEFEEDLNTMQISFTYRNEGTTAYNGTLSIGYMSNNLNANTFVELASFPQTTTLTDVTYVLDSIAEPDSANYLAFKYTGGTGNNYYLSIDDIYVEVIPECPRPSDVTATATTTTSVTLSWTNGGDETSWEIEYGPQGFTPGTGNAESAATNPYTVNNLTPSTVYDFYVRASCGGDMSNPSNVFTISTECEPMTTLPYSENFDSVSGTTATSVAVNNLPNCWHNFNQGTSVSYSGYPIVYSSSTYSASGTNSIRFYTYSTTGTYDDQIAILPMFDPVLYPVNTLQLSFDFRDNTTSYPFNLVVGVMSNPNDKTTFVAVDTVTTQVTSYQNVEITFSQYTGADGYIALMAPQPTSGYNYGYVDNVLVEPISSCPKPHDLTFLSATITSVEMGWTEMGSATTWEIAYGAPGFDPDGNDAAYVTATSNPFTVQNLNSSTTYDFYVRALCSGTEVSYWSSKMSASTNMVPVDLPYTADFTDATDAWVLNNGNCVNHWVKGTVDNTGALFVTDNGTTPNYTANAVSMVAAQKLFTVGTADSVTITFDVQVDGEGNYDYMKLFLAPASTQFPATTATATSSDYGYNDYSTDAYDFYNNGYGTQSSHPYVLNKLTGTVHVVAKMPNPNATPTSTSTALLVFAWRNDVSVANQPPATVTNLTVTAEGSGPVVTDPTVATTAATNIAQTAATLNGTINNPDNVTITAKGFEWKATAGGTYAPVTVTGNNLTYNLTGLTANTNYTYKAFITYNGTTVYGSEMTFTTLPQGVEPCDVPTGLHTMNVQNEAIAIAWNANANVNSWNIQYRPQNGTWSSASSNTNSYTITGLTGDTDYEIQVQANCGDGNLSDWSASITAHTTNVGIEDHLANSVVLFPNPANDIINVQSSMFNVQSVEVIDVYGKVINTVNVVDNPTRINVSNLANGMYFVRVTTEEGVVTKQFVKR